MSEGAPDPGKLRGASFGGGSGGIDPAIKRPFPLVPVVGVILTLIALVTLGIRSNQNERVELRRELLREHEARIGSRGQAVRSFRNRLEGMILAAAAQKSPDVLEPGFRIESLRGRIGIYARLRERETVDATSVGTALAQMEPDVVAHCLSLTPTAARILFTRFEPLTANWLTSRRDDPDPLRLRVAVDEVKRFAERDLPALESVVESDYVLLTVIRGEDRATDPVDLYVLDAQTGRVRLGLDTRANGYLLTARIAGVRAPPPEREALMRSGANDCSIAAQARTRTGEFGAVAGSGLPDAGPAASPRDAGTVPATDAGRR